MSRRRNPPSLLSNILQAALTSATQGNPSREREEYDDNLDEDGDDRHGYPWESGDDDDDELDDDVDDAADAYEAFHWGNEPDSIQEVEIPDPPKALIMLGKLEGVIYRTAKGKRKQESFIHFHDESNLPTLACDPKTSQLYIIGGKYRVTPRGIED